jgi:hypothetical protein
MAEAHQEEDFSPKFFRYHRSSLLSLHYSFSKRRVTGGKESSPSEPHEEKKDSRFGETRRDGEKGGGKIKSKRNSTINDFVSQQLSDLYTQFNSFARRSAWWTQGECEEEGFFG